MISVYKIGGNVMENPEMLDSFCREFASVEGSRILVHGGGTMASDIQQALGMTPVKIEGRRVTDIDTLKVVTMTYAGWCNKMIVATLQKYGCNAIGMAGCDASVIKAEKRAPRLLADGSTVVDYGYVGDVAPDSVNSVFLESLLRMGLVPVLCAINHDGKGQLLNTNADTVASSVASAIRGRLVCCFELDGVLSDINDPKSVLERITSSDFAEMKASGKVSDGMIPKIENCLLALKNGATGAVIRSFNDIKSCSGTEITL